MQGPSWEKKQQQQQTSAGDSLAHLFGEVIVGADLSGLAQAAPEPVEPEQREHDPEFVDFSQQQLMPALEALRAGGYRDLSPLGALAEHLPGDRAGYQLALEHAQSAVSDTDALSDRRRGYLALRSLNSWIQDSGLCLTMLVFPTQSGRAEDYQLRLNRILEIHELSVPGGSCPVFDIRDLHEGEKAAYQGFHDEDLNLSAVYPDGKRRLAADLMRMRSADISVNVGVDVEEERIHRNYAYHLERDYPDEQSVYDLFMHRARLEEALHGLDHTITQAYGSMADFPGTPCEQQLRFRLATLVNPGAPYRGVFEPQSGYNPPTIRLLNQSIFEMSADLSIAQILPNPVSVSAKWVKMINFLHRSAVESGGGPIRRGSVEGNFGTASAIAVLLTSPTRQKLRSSSFSLNNPDSLATLLGYANELHSLAVQDPGDFVARCRLTRAAFFQPHYDPASATLRKVAVYRSD